MKPDDRRYLDELPSALDEALLGSLRGERLAVFLDFDGTLSPIVAHADDARPEPGARTALRRLAARHPVAVVSGRDREDVTARVDVEGVYYAGGHGFDISGPGGFEARKGDDYRALLAQAASRLRSELHGIEGVWVELKQYAVAVHFRLAAPGAESRVAEAVRRQAGSGVGLRVTGGKKIYELRPEIPWDKGTTVEWLIKEIAPGPHRAVYIGDDETDEDALEVMTRIDGVGVVVGGDHRLTWGSHRLGDPSQVVVFLTRLAE